MQTLAKQGSADALASGSATTVYLSPPADFKQVKFHIFIFAGVAELADALASGASVRKDVWVQVPPSAPRKARFFGLFSFVDLSAAYVTYDTGYTRYIGACAKKSA